MTTTATHTCVGCGETIVPMTPELAASQGLDPRDFEYVHEDDHWPYCEGGGTARPRSALFEVVGAAQLGDRPRLRGLLRDMPVAELEQLRAAVDDLDGELDLAINDASWRETAQLARDCRDAGLVVVQLRPYANRPGQTQRYAVSLWTPELTIWQESSSEDADSIRAGLIEYGGHLARQS